MDVNLDKGKVLTRPAGMSDEDWQTKLKEEGLVELKGAAAKRFREMTRRMTEPQRPPNRHERRAMAAMKRKGKR